MIDKKHLLLAQKIRDYHCINDTVVPVDCILAFGSHDTRVANRASELYLSGFAPYVLFSGGVGRYTEDRAGSEAEIFAAIAKDMGVPETAMLIENKSTNSAENIKFSMKLLEENNIKQDKLLIVHKPYMQRRAYATFKKHFPDQDMLVTAQQVSLQNYLTTDIPLERIINLVVGDLQRIMIYPEKGFQILQEVPTDVINAMNELIKLGYDKELIV